jgi:hypothetical protein
MSWASFSEAAKNMSATILQKYLLLLLLLLPSLCGGFSLL